MVDAMVIIENELREKLICALKAQGFSISPSLKPEDDGKEFLKKIQTQKRVERLKYHRNFLKENFKKAKQYSISGEDLQPEKIDLKLIEVTEDSIYAKLFLWWNLVWWSIPYDKPIGRQMRFMLWDKYHNAPFGLFCLQSPPLRSTLRNHYLGLNNSNIGYWINQSMYGQRIGAIPPYNELLGGKMVALSMTSNQVRKAYKEKYNNKVTILKNRVLPNNLLFITTTSAYGKSSMYDRLKYNGERVGDYIGYTAGQGTFHIPEELYIECLEFLKQKDIDVTRGYGTGPSRKLELLRKAFKFLKISAYSYHNIKRGVYLFSNVENLRYVISENQKPKYYNRPFNNLANYWLERYCIPRSNRMDTYKHFNANDYFNKVEEEIDTLIDTYLKDMHQSVLPIDVE